MKTTMRYHLTPLRMVIIKKSTNSKCWRGCGEKGTFLHCWWECKLVQPLWRTVWRFLKKLKIQLPYDPAIPLLGIYPQKNMVQKDTCTPMFIAALFTIAKTRKQPKCPATDEWIKKMWYIHSVEYYSAIKKNEIMPFTTTWMDLENIIFNTKWSKPDRERQISYDIPYMRNLKKNDTNELIYKTETDSQALRMNLWLPGGKGQRRDRCGGWDWHVYTAIFKTDNQQGPTVKK